MCECSASSFNHWSYVLDIQSCMQLPIKPEALFRLLWQLHFVTCDNAMFQSVVTTTSCCDSRCNMNHLYHAYMSKTSLSSLSESSSSPPPPTPAQECGCACRVDLHDSSITAATPTAIPRSSPLMGTSTLSSTPSIIYMLGRSCHMIIRCARHA